MLAKILMFLLIFSVSEEDVVVPVAATMSRMGGCTVDFSPVGIFPAVVGNILSPQDA